MSGKTLFCGHCQRPVIQSPVFHNDICYHLECTQSPYKPQQNWYGPAPTFGPLPKQPGSTHWLSEAMAKAFKDKDTDNG